MLPLLKIVLVIVILTTVFETHKGETDLLTYEVVTNTPQVSKWESPGHFSNYRRPGSVLATGKASNLL